MAISTRFVAILSGALINFTLYAATPSTPPTAAEAANFVAKAERELLELGIAAERAGWVQANFITVDTMAMAADAAAAYTTAAVRLATGAARFNDLQLDSNTRRKLDLLRRSMTLPAPPDPALTKELTAIASDLEGTYGQGEYCRDGTCLGLTEMGVRMAESRDPEELLDLWIGWRKVAPPMRDDYSRLAEITNQGSRDLGYADTGALWRSGYDMEPDAFSAELDRLWSQVKPLYEALHCHVRARLGAKYGTDLVPQDQPIPAHLLGNMWAQSWNNIYDVAAPADADPGYDLTKQIVANGMDEKRMVRIGEAFFTSLGFDPLPESFWSRSLFTQPQDRDVVCHASAWDIDTQDDLRIKMCIQKTAEDFAVIHHELGHNFYQRAYKEHSYFYQASANDGFHEAIGDTVALSITPAYLEQLKLIDKIPDTSKDIGLLMQQAMDKVAFLPFGLLVDKWRWQVFSGKTTATTYNADWWALRTGYQGIRPPVSRTEADFDPGAKYHIPGNTPYARYFLAHILQFQFHQALCEIAGFKGPLHRCTIYNDKKAGDRLKSMLAMGSSKPWPEALAALTGTRQMDAGPILDYFAPLKKWLDGQNRERQCGW